MTVCGTLPDHRRSLLPWLALLAGLLALAGFMRQAEAEVHDTCEGFIDSVPAVIATQGVWCLRGNVSTAQSSGYAIEIVTNNVTIDCNGFKIGGLGAGKDSRAMGIHAYDRMNITVRNCNVRGFLHGISLRGPSAGGHLVEDNRLDGNLYVGIDVYGDNNMVRRNHVHATGGGTTTSSVTTYGIFAQGSAVENIVDGIEANRMIGIRIASAGQVVRGNVVRNLVPEAGQDAIGILALDDSSVVDNHVYAGPGTSTGTSGHGFRNGAVCLRNTVYGFSTPYADCGVSVGNLP